MTDKHKIKLVLADIDGTLVPLLSKKPSKRVVEACNRVQSQGVDIAPVTGRPYGFAINVLKYIQFHDLGVFDAGASVRKVSSGEVVWKNWLSVDRIKKMLEILIPVSDIIDYSPEFNEVKANTVDINDVREDAPYIFAFIHDNKSGREVVNSLKKDPTISINVHYADKKWEGFLNVQITDHKADKYHGVMALRKIINSDFNTTLAIGDSSNDIPLFRAASVKVAMGNATKELKELADYVVADVGHDGFAEAIERFVLVD